MNGAESSFPTKLRFNSSRGEGRGIVVGDQARDFDPVASSPLSNTVGVKSMYGHAFMLGALGR